MASAIILLTAYTSVPALVIATVLWGASFGGASPQLQSALTHSGGANSDIANSFLPVAFNLAIFAAGILGGVLLTSVDALVLPVVATTLGSVALLLTFHGRRSAFTGRH